MILRPAILLSGALLSGCIVDYQMRTNRFISPEAQGKLGAGQFQTAHVGAHEVFVIDTLSLGQIPPAEFRGSTHMLDLGASVGLGETASGTTWRPSGSRSSRCGGRRRSSHARASATARKSGTRSSVLRARAGACMRMSASRRRASCRSAGRRSAHHSA